jgi:Flp pilus assembly protein TadG
LSSNGVLSRNSAHNGHAPRGYCGRVSFALRPRSAAYALKNGISLPLAGARGSVKIGDREGAARSIEVSRRSGQAGILMVLSLTLLFGVLGLAIDVGWGYYKRQTAQTAADAAALAAASWAADHGLTCGTGGVTCASATTCSYPNVNPPTSNLQVGCSYAAANGFVNHGSQTVTMMANTTTPPGVTGNRPNYWARATVTDTVFNLFGAFGGNSAFAISASATAGITTFGAGACIYALDRTAADAFKISGSAQLVATCGIFVNSSNSGAFSAQGTSQTTSNNILVNGGASVANNASVTPAPTTNAGSQPDPLASLAMPTVTATCDHTNFSVANTQTLSPGTYCGGITVQGGGQVTFSPGMYILNGAGMTFNGGSTATGSGVTFFNTGQYGQSPGPVNFAGGSLVTLSAPTSGTYQGMLVVQDRNLSYNQNNNFTTGAASTITGTLYFPSTAVTYAGASNTGSYTALVAKTVAFTGTSNFKNDPTGTFTGLASTVRALIQ